MAQMPENFTITTSGEYDFENLRIGEQYVAELVVAEGSTLPESVSVQFPIGPNNAFADVQDNEFNDTDQRGIRFVAPSKTIRFVVTTMTSEFRILLREVDIL